MPSDAAAAGSGLHGLLDCLKQCLEVAEAEKGYGMDAFRNLFTVGHFQASDRKSSVAPALLVLLDYLVLCSSHNHAHLAGAAVCFLHQFEGLTLMKIRCIWP